MVSRKHLTAACCIVVILLTSEFMVTTTSAVDNETDEEIQYWQQLAAKAWNFYEPGKALNTQTGLYAASMDWQYFTEWDLGTQVNALIDARAIGLLSDSGEWGFDNRIAKIISFLKSRELTSNNLPYALYDSKTGQPYNDDETFSIDEGNLYMALYNLAKVKPEYTEDINYIVKTRNNNTRLLSERPERPEWVNSNDLYFYYISYAFKNFEFEGWDDMPSIIMGNIVSRQNITTYGVKLPSAHICVEPLVETFFEINPDDERFTWLANQIYQAHEARYLETGYYTAFSEGNTGLGDPSYIYEFVVDSDGVAWKVEPKTTPVAYLKVAVSFDAIFDTTYTKNMVDYIIDRLPFSTSGFQEGVNENGGMVYSKIDRTNKQIISAARYAIEHAQNTPTTTPTSPPTSEQPNASPTSGDQNGNDAIDELPVAAAFIAVLTAGAMIVLVVKKGKNKHRI